MNKPKTLADCAYEKAPQCFHCEKDFKKDSPIEVFGRHVVIHCLAYGCMTPYKLKEK